MAAGPDRIDAVRRAKDTRRALLAKAGVVAAGGAGLAALARPDTALAASPEELMLEEYNSVKAFGAAQLHQALERVGATAAGSQPGRR